MRLLDHLTDFIGTVVSKASAGLNTFLVHVLQHMGPLLLRFWKSLWQWKAWEAIAALGLLAVTGFYIPFFSDLPKAIDRASQLAADNERVTIQQQDTQNRFNEAHNDTIEAINQRMLAQDNAREAERRFETVQASVAALTLKQTELTAQLSNSRSQLASASSKLTDLDAQSRMVSGELDKANLALRKGIDALIAVSFASRYTALIVEMSQNNILLIPTTEAGGDHGRATSYCFMAISKETPTGRREDTKSVYDAGTFRIEGAKEEIDASTGLKVSAQQISPQEPKFRKLIDVLNSPMTFDVPTYISVSERYGLDARKGWLVRDLLARATGSKYYAVCFLPGQIGETRFEEPFIRGFWFPAIGSLRAGAVLDAVQKENSVAQTATSDSLAKASVSISQASLQAAIGDFSDILGPTGAKYLGARLHELDDAWLATLNAESLPIRLNKPFNFEGPGKLEAIFERWDWDESPRNLTKTFLNNLDDAYLEKFVLACSAARFLNGVLVAAKTPDVLTRVDICHNSEERRSKILLPQSGVLDPENHTTSRPIRPNEQREK